MDRIEEKLRLLKPVLHPSQWNGLRIRYIFESDFRKRQEIESMLDMLIAQHVPGLPSEQILLPPPDEKLLAGEYPIGIRVSSADAKGEAQLVVILTGTYGLEVGTASGLLSLNAARGKPANLSFYVKNSGSAANHDIKFMSFKPENWNVTFNPEQIDLIDPGDLKQIEMTITPYDDALVGDYSISVNIEGEKASKMIEFRTTVKASAAWGWIGRGRSPSTR